LHWVDKIIIHEKHFGSKSTENILDNAARGMAVKTKQYFQWYF